MAYLNNFDANTVDPATSFDPLPAGKYVAAITESQMKPTKSGNGHYLELTFDVLDDGSPAGSKYKGRKVWARLNLDNPNAQTVQIARGELSAICRAVGVMQPKDSVELHNLPLCIKVVCKKRDDSNEIVNEIRGYEKKEAAFSTNTAAPSTPAPQSINNAAPWHR